MNKFKLGQKVKLVSSGLGTQETVTGVGMTEWTRPGMPPKKSLDQLWEEYIDMARIRTVDDIAGAMMVRDSACAAFVRAKMLTSEPSDLDVAVWLDSFTRPKEFLVPTIEVKGSWYLAEGPRMGCAVDGSLDYITEVKA